MSGVAAVGFAFLLVPALVAIGYMWLLALEEVRDGSAEPMVWLVLAAVPLVVLGGVLIVVGST